MIPSLRWIACAAAGVVMCAGCVNREPVAYIEVPSTLALLPTAPTTRNVLALKRRIEPVTGSTTSTTISFARGSVALSGVVYGPDGEPVPEAVVVLTRIVGEQRAVLRVETNADGRYAVRNVKGGVVELYAYKPPELSAGDARVIFASGDTKQDLSLGDFSEIEILWSVGPGTPMLARALNLTVQLNIRRVDPDGVVRPAPLEGINVRIVPLGALQPTGDTERLTDERGLASFSVQCNSVGPSDMQAFFATGEDTVIKPAPCLPPPTTIPPVADTRLPGEGPPPQTSLPATATEPDAPAAPVPTIPVNQ